jgi:hypothetical protein
MPEEITEGGDTSAWMAVLDRLIGELGRTLEQIPAIPAPSSPASADYPPLHAIDQRLSQMQTGLERAEQDASEAERQLAAILDPLQKWLGQIRAGRETLTVQVKVTEAPVSTGGENR